MSQSFSIINYKNKPAQLPANPKKSNHLRKLKSDNKIKKKKNQSANKNYNLRTTWIEIDNDVAS